MTQHLIGYTGEKALGKRTDAQHNQLIVYKSGDVERKRRKTH